MSEKRVLTIDRSKWRRGGNGGIGAGVTALLNEQGFMCCLGFDAIGRGLTAGQIRDCMYPTSVVVRGRESVDSDYAKALLMRDARGVIEGDNHLARSAAEANDNKGIDDAEREALVRKNLIALGWDDVVFVDGGAA